MLARMPRGRDTVKGDESASTENSGHGATQAPSVNAKIAVRCCLAIPRACAVGRGSWRPPRFAAFSFDPGFQPPKGCSYNVVLRAIPVD